MSHPHPGSAPRLEPGHVCRRVGPLGLPVAGSAGHREPRHRIPFNSVNERLNQVGKWERVGWVARRVIAHRMPFHSRTEGLTRDTIRRTLLATS